MTDIVASSWPEWIPTIVIGRVNNRDTSENQMETERAAPYQKTVKATNDGPKTNVNSGHDADTGILPTHLTASEFGWTNPPKSRRMEKSHSKIYKTSTQSPDSEEISRISMGAPSNRHDAIAQGASEIIKREPERRFEFLLNAFKELQISYPRLGDFTVEPCTTPGRQVRRGDLDCWRFIDNITLKTGRHPKRNWRLVKYDRSNKHLCIFRTALVVRLRIEDEIIHWIEIENRETETGFCSVVLANAKDAAQEVIVGAMEIIVEKGGMAMRERLTEEFSELGIRSDCAKHKYDSNGHFSTERFRNVLDKF